MITLTNLVSVIISFQLPSDRLYQPRYLIDRAEKREAKRQSEQVDYDTAFHATLPKNLQHVVSISPSSFSPYPTKLFSSRKCRLLFTSAAAQTTFDHGSKHYESISN